jgi:2-amino-4-hydroxy-6-hydroxymethyldihydropteridine diphosphokinase
MCEIELMSGQVACAIGLGSNLGDSRGLLDLSIESLESHPQIQVTRVASYYSTKPVGPPQPDYLNSAVTIITDLSPWNLLLVLQGIENCSGRERQVRWGARTLDLDLLLYGRWCIDTLNLQVPHPRMFDRGFVLVPLSEIAGDWWCGQGTVEDWCSIVDCAGVDLATGSHPKIESRIIKNQSN